MRGSANYKITFNKVHFRTSELIYSDSTGTVRACCEESYLTEVDWCFLDSDFGPEGDRREMIIQRVLAWAEEQGLRMLIGPPKHPA